MATQDGFKIRKAQKEQRRQSHYPQLVLYCRCSLTPIKHLWSASYWWDIQVKGNTPAITVLELALACVLISCSTCRPPKLERGQHSKRLSGIIYYNLSQRLLNEKYQDSKPENCFAEIDKLILKIWMEIQGPAIAKMILKKNKLEEHTLPSFKT